MRIPKSVGCVLASGFAAACLASVGFAQTSIAQTLDAPTQEYMRLLQAIADTQDTLAQKELFVARQKEQIASLRAQARGLNKVKAALPPMVEKMVSSIETQINADYPFEMDRRAPRLQALKQTVKDKNVSIVDKYRKALNIYKFEVNYGMSMESTKGNHPINPVLSKCDLSGDLPDECYEKDKDGKVKIDKKTGEKTRLYDGRYLRYGRLAYVYMDNDGVSALRYDLGERKWVEIPRGRAAAIRKAVKIASGEAAPSVVMVPVSPTP